MQISGTTLALGAALLAAGAFALGRETSPPNEPPRLVERDPEPASEPQGGQDDPTPTATHPSMAPTGTQDFASPSDEPAVIEWTVPPAWHVLPNSSSMRLATYSVPRAAGDPADADVSVTRAGGDTTSNIARWAGQFEGAPAPSPTTHTVRGREITMVQIEGTYTNAMAPGAKPQPGWALLAAIVKTPGMPYFFKMTGPAPTVRAARAAFTAMIDGIQSAG
jgi:hypothetical protein